MVALALCTMLLSGQTPAEPEVSDRPVRLMSRRELKAEWRNLDERRPGVSHGGDQFM